MSQRVFAVALVFSFLFASVAGLAAPAASSGGPEAAAAGGLERWRRTLDTPGAAADRVEGMAVSGTGDLIYSVGASASDDGGGEWLVAAASSTDGASLWTKRSSVGWGAVARHAAETPDGARLIVAGRGPSGFAVGAYRASDGQPQWHVNAPGNGGVTAIAITADGALAIVTGGPDPWAEPYSSSGAMDVVAFRVSDGQVAWRTTVASGGYQAGAAGTSLALDGGRAIVAGWRFLPDGNGAPVRSAYAAAVDLAAGDLLWSAASMPPDGGASAFRSVAVASGVAYFAGSVASPGVPPDAWVVAVDVDDGATVWSAAYGAGGADVARSVAVAAGAVVTSAESDLGSWTDVLTAAHDPVTGAAMWTHRDSGVIYQGGDDFPVRVLLSPSSPDAYVVAQLDENTIYAQGEVGIFAYDLATGATVWNATWDTPVWGGAETAGAAVLSAGDLVVAGTARTLYRNQDGFALRFPPGAASPAWVGFLNTPGHASERGADIAMAPGGGAVTAVGTAQSTPDDQDPNVVVASYTSAGAPRWTATWDNAGRHDSGVAVAYSPDGATVYVAGATAPLGDDPAGGAAALVLLAYDAASGGLRWTVTDVLIGDAYAMDVAATSTAVYVGGITTAPGNWYGRAFLAAYAPANGAHQWTVTDGSGTAQEFVSDIAIGADGTIYAGGSLPGSDVGVMAVSPAGSKLWVRGLGKDSPYDFAYGGGMDLRGGRILVYGHISLDAGGNAGELGVIDPGTGDLLWAARVPEATYVDAGTLSSDASTAIMFGTRYENGENVVVGTGFDTAAGAQVWQETYSPGSVTASFPTHNPQLVFAYGAAATSTSNPAERLMTIDITTGEVAGSETRESAVDWAGSAVPQPDSRGLFATGGTYAFPNEEDLYVVHLRLPDPPTAPRNFRATAGPGRGTVTLAWDPPQSDGGGAIQAYRILRGASAASLEPLDEVDAATLTFADSGHGDGASFVYVVHAVNAGGVGPASAAVVGVTASLPTAPRAVSAATGPGPGAITVSWVPPQSTGAVPLVSYHVLRGTSSSSLEFVAMVSPTSTSYRDEGLTAVTTYWYALVAENEVGLGPASAPPASAVAGDYPGAPRNARADPGTVPGDVRVVWDNPTYLGGVSIQGYRIYRSVDNGPWELAGTTGSGSRSFTDPLRTPLTAHEYRVTAFNRVGEGAPSATSCTNPGPWVVQPGVTQRCDTVVP